MSKEKRLERWFEQAYKDPDNYLKRYKEGLSFLGKFIKTLGENKPINPDKVLENKNIKEKYNRGFAGYNPEKREEKLNCEDPLLKRAIELLNPISERIAHPTTLFQEFSKKSKHYFPNLKLEQLLNEIGAESSELSLVYGSKVLLDLRRRVIEPLYAELKSLKKQQCIHYVNEEKWEPLFLRKSEYWRGLAKLVEKKLLEYSKKIYGEDFKRALNLWQSTIFITTSNLPSDLKKKEIQKPILYLLVKRDWDKAENELLKLAEAHPELFKEWKLQSLGADYLIEERRKILAATQKAKQKQKVNNLQMAESKVRIKLLKGDYCGALAEASKYNLNIKKIYSKLSKKAQYKIESHLINTVLKTP